MSKTYYFSLPGITCINCVKPVQDMLQNYHEIKIEETSLDVVQKRIAITVADDNKFSSEEISQKLKNAIEDVGVDAIEMGHEEKIKSKFKSHLIKGISGTLISFIIMALMMSGVGIPLLVMYGLMASSALLTLYFGADSYREAFKKLVKSKTLTMDTLFALSGTTIIAVSFASIFFPWLPMMFEAGLMIFGFRHLGQAIEESIKRTVVAELNFRNRVSPTTKKLNVSDEIEDEKFPITQLKENDVILVAKGEVIPVDGECLDEESMIYDTILTGSTLPRMIKKSAALFAGMKVPDHIPYLKMKVLRPQETSYLAKLDKNILDANAEKTPIETSANTILQYFVPLVIGIAVISGIIIGAFFTPALAIQCAISVLVSACPCTLGLITPISVTLGMSKASSNGVEFKTGKALQAAEQIDTVVFDLNGTLTTGVPIVSRPPKILKNISLDDFYNYLYSLEQISTHPIAKAICSFAQKKVTANLMVTEFDTSQHCGISGIINNEKFIVGNESMMQKHGIDITQYQEELKNFAGQVIFLARENELLGYLLLKDPLCHDAIQTIHELKKMGKEVHICTGASQATAQSYAKELGISSKNIYADCVGADNGTKQKSKVDYIKQLQAKGKKVSMIGDAANDAVALTKSHFGIAIDSNSGDEITRQQAGAVIQRDSLLPIVTTFVIAKQTIQNIKQNLVMSLAYNSLMLLIAGGVFVAIGFALNPGIGVALMVLQTSLIFLNQWRLKKQALPHLNAPQVQPDVKPPSLQSTYQFLNQRGLAPQLSTTVNNENEIIEDLSEAEQHNQSKESVYDNTTEINLSFSNR